MLLQSNQLSHVKDYMTSADGSTYVYDLSSFRDKQLGESIIST